MYVCLFFKFYMQINMYECISYICEHTLLANYKNLLRSERTNRKRQHEKKNQNLNKKIEKNNKKIENYKKNA